MIPRNEVATDDRDSGEVITKLGEYAPETLLDIEALAGIFSRCTATIKRAVRRGELPRPVKVCGKARWSVKCILQHIEKRLRAEQESAEKENKRIQKLSPR
jgi:predicted DNA-binding transcriptional regulator AlpA